MTKKEGNVTSVIRRFVLVRGQTILFCAISRFLLRLFEHRREVREDLQRLIHFLFKNIFLFKLLFLFVLWIFRICYWHLMLLECFDFLRFSPGVSVDMGF
jgi:hypothetical protein